MNQEICQQLKVLDQNFDAFVKEFNKLAIGIQSSSSQNNCIHLAQ
jgi:hypothetical protein